MESLATDLVSTLQYLLPGFVAAWIFYNLTSFPLPSQFERVVQALIFTLFIQVTIIILEVWLKYVGNYWAIAKWDESSRVIWAVAVAVLFGLIFSYFANNDKLHNRFRAMGITRESSFPSEWFRAFSENVTFVVLHLHDERRLYGWPIEWPSEPTKGYFLLTAPS